MQKSKIIKLQQPLIDAENYSRQLVILHDYMDSDEFKSDMQNFKDSDDESEPPPPKQETAAAVITSGPAQG